MNYTEIEVNGQKWRVSNGYVFPVGIGEAIKLARDAGCELPSPKLVDHIWKAARVRIPPPVRTYVDPKERRADTSKGEHDGTAATMASPETYASQWERVDNAYRGCMHDEDKMHGLTYQEVLCAGSHKDVVLDPATGKAGLYGWHKLGGGVWQPFYAGHALSWKDYSQGLRLCRKVT